MWGITKYLLKTLILLFIVEGSYCKNSRLHGGQTISVKRASHQAMISIKQAGTWRCGGSLIHRNYVLTAAHCLALRDLPMVLVETSAVTVFVASEDSSVVKAFSSVEEMKIHEDYRVRCKGNIILGYDNDIALIKLVTRFPLNQFIGVIDIGHEVPNTESSCKITGWGFEQEFQPSPNLLKEMTVQVKVWEECNQAYSNDYISAPLHPNTTCVGLQLDSWGNCQGDYGGPLVCDGNLVGLLSYSRGECGSSDLHDVYTDVTKYVDWIETNGAPTLLSFAFITCLLQMMVIAITH